MPNPLPAIAACYAMAVLALQEAAAFEQEAEQVQARQPSDPSGSDDTAALAEDQRSALRRAAEGRAGDALVAAREVGRGLGRSTPIDVVPVALLAAIAAELTRLGREPTAA